MKKEVRRCILRPRRVQRLTIGSTSMKLLLLNVEYILETVIHDILEYSVSKDSQSVKSISFQRSATIGLLHPKYRERVQHHTRI